MFDLEIFLYWFCYFDAICTKAMEMAAGVRDFTTTIRNQWQTYAANVKCVRKIGRTV